MAASLIHLLPRGLYPASPAIFAGPGICDSQCCFQPRRLSASVLAAAPVEDPIVQIRLSLKFDTCLFDLRASSLVVMNIHIQHSIGIPRPHGNVLAVHGITLTPTRCPRGSIPAFSGIVGLGNSAKHLQRFTGRQVPVMSGKPQLTRPSHRVSRGGDEAVRLRLLPFTVRNEFGDTPRDGKVWRKWL